MDEYARSFKSKMNISALQYLGESLETAKQATENSSLTLLEKFDRQNAFVNVSLKRLFDAIGGMRFEGIGVDMQGTVEEGEDAIVGPVSLFLGKNGTTAGIVMPQPGSTKPLIRQEPDRAIFYYERAESIDAFEVNAKVRHAQVLVSLGRYADAIPLLRRALEVKPRDDVSQYLNQIERIAKTR